MLALEWFIRVSQFNESLPGSDLRHRFQGEKTKTVCGTSVWFPRELWTMLIGYFGYFNIWLVLVSTQKLMFISCRCWNHDFCWMFLVLIWWYMGFSRWFAPPCCGPIFHELFKIAIFTLDFWSTTLGISKNQFGDRFLCDCHGFIFSPIFEGFLGKPMGWKPLGKIKHPYYLFF